MATAPSRRSAPPPPAAAATSSGYADVAELERYKLISNIGKGSFGVISKVQRVEDGKEFALKQLDYSKMTDKDRKQILAEVAILEALKHRNIVQLIQKIKDPKNERIYIVMEYCTSGDLGSLIRKAHRSNQPLNEDKIWNIFLQIVQALHHCHWPNERSQQQIAGKLGQPSRPAADGQVMDAGAMRYQVLHRDLKPENVFLSDDFVKLGDFGLSKDMGTAAFTSTYVGTPLYMPPEILSENKYDTKSDIWSLGCLVFEMCALVSPFSTATTQVELIGMVRSGRLPAIPTTYSPALRNVIKSMLNLNPTKRPSTKDLLELEEMKLHRKLFAVQNQSSLLMTRKEEMRKYEESLLARLAMIEERERALMTREAYLFEREEQCAIKEREAMETQQRLNLAAEGVRAQWEKLREERSVREGTMQAASALHEQIGMRRPSMPYASRPILEERSTMPVTTLSRITRQQHPAYEDTPSKIPISSLVSPSLGLPRASGQPQSLRRHASKSLGNLGAAARARAEADLIAMTAMMPMPIDSTPAKQVIGGHRAARNSIGSPGEAKKEIYAPAMQNHGGLCMAAWSDDISMASPALSIASPWMPGPLAGGPAGGRRTRKNSVAPANALQPTSSGSSLASADSATSIDSAGEVPTYWTTDGSTGQHVHAATSMPGQPLLTPAKWTMEDPDIPSPFLRRMPTAPPALVSAPPQPNSHAPGTGTGRDRAPLGSINPQPAVSSAPSSNAVASANSIGSGKKAGSMPRSRSGGLHQHVLRSNAAAAQADKRASATGESGSAVSGSGGVRTRAAAGAGVRRD